MLDLEINYRDLYRSQIHTSLYCKNIHKLSEDDLMLLKSVLNRTLNDLRRTDLENHCGRPLIEYRFIDIVDSDKTQRNLKDSDFDFGLFKLSKAELADTFAAKVKSAYERVDEISLR